MKKTLIRLLAISCLLAAGSLNSVAQENKPRPDKARVPTDGTFKISPLMAPKMAFGKVVKGAPYSATAVTETIQTLSDGNQIIRENESKLYRDSEGRTRIEQTLETIGKWAAGGEAQQHIFINDPVAGVSYSLDPRTHTAYKNVNGQKVRTYTYTINGKTVTQAEFEAFADAKKKREAEEGLPVRRRKEASKDSEFNVNGKTVTQAEFEAAREKMRKSLEEMPAKPRKVAPNDPEVEKQLKTLQLGKPDIDAGQKKAESLGTQTIEGVTTEGTRLTLTIPAGEIGNTLPIEVVDETWYSSELQMVIMKKHRDPRSGETTYRLTNLSRGEPDRSLFEVPADYIVSEGKLPPKPKQTKEEE